MTTTNRVPEGVPTGGQFAASAKTEAGVTLNVDAEAFYPIPAYDASFPLDVNLEDAEYENTPLGRALIGLAEAYNEHHAAPCCDSETTLRDWQETGFYPKADYSGAPLALALTEAGLPGTFRMTGEGTADYSDEDGHFYDLSHDKGSIQVRSQDTDALVFLMPFNAKKNPLHPTEVVDALASCRVQAADIRGFNTAAAAWFAKGPDEESPHAPEPKFDHDAGSASVGGVTIGTFTRDDRDMDGATMRVWIDDADTRNVEDASFTFFQNKRTGNVSAYRGEDRSQPLAFWEKEALDSLVMERSRRSGFTRHVQELFTNSIKAADKQN